MSDRKLSRRDWFRLKKKPIEKPRQPKLGNDPQPSPPTGPSPGPTDSVNGLTEIAHPPNHDGMNLDELPPMREAMLGQEQVNELFDDLGQWASDIQLMQRQSGQRRADASRVQTADQLQIAKSSLLNASLKRVQIRYRWENALWIDTIVAQEQGFRLVRIRHDAS